MCVRTICAYFVTVSGRNWPRTAGSHSSRMNVASGVFDGSV
jgi:hypothetical protein